jgi:hypothetical protein
MELNDQGVVVLPREETQWDTALAQARDEHIRPFAAVKAEHTRTLAGDMAAIDELESQTLAAIARVKVETVPTFHATKVQALGDEVLRRLEVYETNRVGVFVTEHARLVASLPQASPPSDADRADYRFVLGVLQGSPIRVLDGERPANLHDPVDAHVLFLQALDDGDIDVVKAMLYGPLKRRRLQALTEDDHRRAQVLLGLAAHPELQAQIAGYEMLIQRYRSRFRQLQRHLAAEGWQALDPLVAQAGPAPRD